MALLALAGGAFAVLADSLPALLVAMFVLGIANRLSQVSSILAGTRGPAAARSEGTASALLTATRQCGSALGVAILSATLVAVRGTAGHRTGVAMVVAAGGRSRARLAAGACLMTVVPACLRPRGPVGRGAFGASARRGASYREGGGDQGPGGVAAAPPGPVGSAGGSGGQRTRAS
jgi:uncharacterized membrane protein YgcG